MICVQSRIPQKQRRGQCALVTLLQIWRLGKMMGGFCVIGRQVDVDGTSYSRYKKRTLVKAIFSSISVILKE